MLPMATIVSCSEKEDVGPQNTLPEDPMQHDKISTPQHYHTSTLKH